MADAQGPRTPVPHRDQRWALHQAGRSRLCGGLRARRPLFLGLEVWDDVLPEEAKRVQDFLVLGGPYCTQQEDFLAWLNKSAVSTPLKLLRLGVYWTAQ